MPINIPGFVPATNAKPHLKLIVEGFHRTGRTSFGFSSPGPIGCLVFDGNTEHVAAKSDKDILLNKQFMAGSALNVFSPQSVYQERWEALKHLYFDRLLTSDFRTIMIDTCTDAYELCRMADLGATEKVPQFAYGKVNSTWRQMVNGCEKNLILTHKLQSFGSKVTRKGPDEASYTVHAILRTVRLPKGMIIREDMDDYSPSDRGIPIGYWDAEPGDGDFALKILDCSHNPMLAGKILVGGEVNFTQIARLIFPDTKKSQWV
jgi:hypothetical protein